MSKTKSKSVAAYIAGQPRASQPVLRRVRNAIRQALPDAEEVISYGIPAYRLHGYVALYFAGWGEHYSLYPINTRLISSLKPSSASYEVNDKGTIKFSLSKPVPVKLIGAIAKAKGKEAAARAQAKLRKQAVRNR